MQTHLDGCRRCTAMYLELADVNSNLAGIIGPLLLGAAAAGYLASAGAGIGAGGVVSILSRTKDFVAANSGAVAAGAIATGVAAAAVAAVVVTQVGGGNSPDVVANPPAGVTSGLSSSASPGASSSPNPSTSGSPSTSAPTSTLSASTSPSATLSATSSPSPGLALLGVLPGATDVPSDLASETAPGDGSTGSPGGPATEEPTEEPTEQPTPPPAPGLDGAPVLDANLDEESGNGSVSIHVTNVGLGDEVEVSMQSDHTTFGDPSASECNRDPGNDKAVTCLPLGGGAGRQALAANGDYTVKLPLVFHDLSVPDQITITVTVNGHQVGDAESAEVTPQFDLAMPGLSAPDHTVAGNADRYGFTAAPRMPRGATGLRFRVDGDARFRPGEANGCVVNDGGDTLTCPDATRGSTVPLPVATDGLTAPTDIGFTVSSMGVPDPNPDNNASPEITLNPGAALSMSNLGVLTANPDVDGFVTLQGTLDGVRTGMNGVTYHLLGSAEFLARSNPGCTVGDDGTSLTCDNTDPGPFSLVVHVPDALRHQSNQLDITVTPNAPFVLVGDQNTGSAGRLRSTGARLLADGPRSRGNGHNLDGDTDVYRLTGTVGALPDGVDTLDFAVDGASVPDGQADPSCARVDDGTVRLHGPRHRPQRRC